VATTFYLMRADEIATYFASVTTSAGATDSDYLDDWICDSRPGRPALATSGTVTWAATFSSAEVGLIVVGHCNANVSAAITGGVSTTVIAGALQPDGIRLNGFATVSPANQTTLSVGFSGASANVALGEFIAGKYRTLTLPRYRTDTRSDVDFTRTQDADLSSLPPYDPGLAGRKWSGSFILTTADVEIVRGAFRAQRNGTRPSVIVPDPTVNDAWIGFFSAPVATPINNRYWATDLLFTEIPRVRW
jgi:hypothetical protein